MKGLEAKCLRIYSDSQLVVNKINGTVEAKEEENEEILGRNQKIGNRVQNI